jgi:ABC-type transporter Mla subunit MlaD
MVSPRRRYFRLGLFILGALVVVTLFLIAFGAGYLLQPKVVVETYFNESVQGIDVGTPLRYRGVPVGQVSRIGFTYTDYEQDKPPAARKQYVLVEASVRPEEITGRSGRVDRSVLQALIDRGLRVQMAAQGVTGLYYLELDFVDPQRNQPLQIDWEPDDVYIPSAPSAFGTIVSGAESLMRKLDQANIDELVVNLNRLMLTLNTTLQGMQSDRIGSGVVQLLTEVRESNQRLQAILNNPAWKSVPAEASAAMSSARRLMENEQIPATIARLRQTLENLDRAAARLDRTLVSPERNLPAILENLRQTTENLRDVTETLRRSPSAVLFSEPPAPLPRPGTTRR